MLHLTSQRGARHVALAGYGAILLLSGSAWLALGPGPFASDRGAAQGAAALLFAIAGAAAYRLPSLAFPVRALLAAAGAWLAVDEALMVHESLKFGPLAQLGALRDAPVLLYGVGAAGAALAVARRLRPPREALFHAWAALVAAGAALLLDVGGTCRGGGCETAEEIAELLSAWGAIQFCALAAREGPSASWREALAVAGWWLLCLGAAADLSKPMFAPARLL